MKFKTMIVVACLILRFIRKYEERNNQFMQNRLFQTNQKRLFDILEGKEKSDNIAPNTEESKLFWGEIWGKETKHNDKAQWIKQVQNHTESVEAQEIETKNYKKHYI